MASLSLLLGTGANDILLATEGKCVKRFLKAEKFLWTLSFLNMVRGTGVWPENTAIIKDGRAERWKGPGP